MTSRVFRSAGHIGRPILAVFLVLEFLIGGPSAVSASSPRMRLSESIKPVTAAVVAPSSTDLDQPIEFMVALKMRNYADLLGRIGRGKTISQTEMSAKYYPLAADYQNVVNWLTSQGLTINKTDPNHLGIFVSGRVSQVQQILQVDFGRVSVAGKMYVSAVTPPSIPATLAPVVLGINGLQPHIKPHKHSHRVARSSDPFAARRDPLASPSPLTANHPPFLVSEIMKAYNANGLSVTGAGQKIAIVIDTFPLDSDLTSFWSTNGIAQSLSNIEEVEVVSGTYDPPSGEETLDVEWASGIASGAKVRVYGTLTLDFVNVDQAFQAILDDLPSQPQMHEVSISLGLGEGDVGMSQLQTDAQYFASMVAGGLSVFVSSGDSGSEEGGTTQVSYFASDPNVTAVGGTSLVLSTCSGSASSETVWNNADGGTGGGKSGVFDRPIWQVGTGVPPGSTRLVPDVSSDADPETGGLVILNGVSEQFGGTSWSAPMWAGFCAMINQARANLALPPAGLLGPKLYPLLGTTAFRDITTGNNGAYSAGVGYDLCTGLGVPNIAILLQPLTGGAIPPPASVAGPSGQILTPDPNCPLSSSSAIFSWSAGSASAYWLTVGTTFGGTDICSSGQTGGHSWSVSNIPTDGRPIYVRLWSLVSGTWVNPPQDYTYQAEAAGVMPPIIAPATGTYKKKVTVNMATGTPGAIIYYTLNGTTPTTSASVFSKPFTLKQTTTVRAIAIESGVPDSPVAAAGYTITKK